MHCREKGELEMSNRDKAYLEILKYGLIFIRNSAHDGKPKVCEIEADHLHNIPTLIQEENNLRHRYYLDNERSLYLERRKKNEKDFDVFTFQRYEELWRIIEKETA